MIDFSIIHKTPPLSMEPEILPIAEELGVSKEIDLVELEQIRSFPDKLHGYVYVIDNGDAIKIGKTSNLLKRMKSLMNSNSGGHILKQLFYSPANAIYDTLEQIMHEKFKKYRTTGEWFTGISFEEVSAALNELCNSRDFEVCNLVREEFLVRQRENILLFKERVEELQQLELEYQSA